MSIAKTLDLSIKFNETGASNEGKSYSLSDRQYENYIDNENWSVFVEEMKTKYPLAYAEYGEGSGDELGIKKVGKYPPKMASYGSSSRMIYLLSRDIEGFQFEKKLPTTVGGIANMDGFLQSENIQFFVEAKCREPYSPKSYIIDRKYEALYRYIDAGPSVDIKCNIAIIDDEKMRVQFVAQGTIIMAFDIKQMISHLLGIATKKLNNPTEEKIRFLYLLYNPTSIKIVNPFCLIIRHNHCVIKYILFFITVAQFLKSCFFIVIILFIFYIVLYYRGTMCIQYFLHYKVFLRLRGCCNHKKLHPQLF